MSLPTALTAAISQMQKYLRKQNQFCVNLVMAHVVFLQVLNSMGMPSHWGMFERLIVNNISRMPLEHKLHNIQELGGCYF